MSVRARTVIAFLLSISLWLPAVRAADTSITYPARSGPGNGKHIVFLAGDEEYRSEEALPMLAKILSQRHGFRARSCFRWTPTGRSTRTTASRSRTAPP